MHCLIRSAVNPMSGSRDSSLLSDLLSMVVIVVFPWFFVPGHIAVVSNKGRIDSSVRTVSALSHPNHVLQLQLYSPGGGQDVTVDGDGFGGFLEKERILGIQIGGGQQVALQFVVLSLGLTPGPIMGVVATDLSGNADLTASSKGDLSNVFTTNKNVLAVVY